MRKDLTSLMKRSAGIPTYVLEYLLGMYCATDDEAAIADGMARIRKILAENYVRPEESEKIKSRIRELGQYTVIDKVSARLDEYRDLCIAQFTNLNIEPFVMPDEYVRQHTKILTGGIWCIMRIQYLRPEDIAEDPLADIFGDDPAEQRGRARKGRTSGKGKRGPEDSPFKIASLTPIQMPSLDLPEFVSHREAFSTDEWIALLLRSAGYEPSALTPRERMHFLTRMVPLVELNYNLCELGPRGTGKSHIYTEVSPYSYLLSGGQTTTAKLFANNAARSDSASGWLGTGTASRSTGGGDELTRSKRDPNHEGLHGEQHLRPRQRNVQRRGVHGVRGQYQRLRGQRARNHRTCSTRSRPSSTTTARSSTASTATYPGWEVPKCARTSSASATASSPIAWANSSTPCAGATSRATLTGTSA